MSQCPCDRDKTVDPQCCAAGECARENTCRECGEGIEDFMSDESTVCFGCHEFFAERESRAMGWAEAMEANNERRH